MSAREVHAAAMLTKRAVFNAQDELSVAVRRAAKYQLPLLRKMEKRLARVREQLEALDRDYILACEKSEARIAGTELERELKSAVPRLSRRFPLGGGK